MKNRDGQELTKFGWGMVVAILGFAALCGLLGFWLTGCSMLERGGVTDSQRTVTATSEVQASEYLTAAQVKAMIEAGKALPTDVNGDGVPDRTEAFVVSQVEEAKTLSKEAKAAANDAGGLVGAPWLGDAAAGVVAILALLGVGKKLGIEVKKKKAV